MVKGTASDDSPATWLVTLASGAPIEQVAAALTAAGLAVTSSLEAVGVIVGTAPTSVVPALRKVQGVANVSPDRDVSAGPPDDPETW